MINSEAHTVIAKFVAGYKPAFHTADEYRRLLNAYLSMHQLHEYKVISVKVEKAKLSKFSRVLGTVLCTIMLDFKARSIKWCTEKLGIDHFYRDMGLGRHVFGWPTKVHTVNVVRKTDNPVERISVSMKVEK